MWSGTPYEHLMVPVQWAALSGEQRKASLMLVPGDLSTAWPLL
jgi:hypothetical protein